MGPSLFLPLNHWLLLLDPNINGISYAGECYKLNMFANDALLTLNNLQDLLAHFTQITQHKTTALNLLESLASQLQFSFPIWESR